MRPRIYSSRLKFDPHRPARVINRFDSGSNRPLQGGEVTAQYPCRSAEMNRLILAPPCCMFDKHGVLVILLLEGVTLSCISSLAVEGTALGGPRPRGGDKCSQNTFNNTIFDERSGHLLLDIRYALMSVVECPPPPVGVL
jgi:hypothetical protein